ncbi:response regulator transcription factor [Solirubrobacter ginsenosidimutans]|uniref:Response regulator transcription factor n=1 Tax=Solirubrobacter ginsenosidimutans TaxID=490573 RepID=A0A9X3N3C9_9ACTN|nr:response regulator transcription factor [Solirubrobacter ginsenosidimutans]MDA0166511.1 response regulator transcription factor [Solirubrobacter ginsenosidimutans]
MRVVIAEDQPLFRAGLHRLLTETGFDVVGEAADAPDLLRKVRAHRPDVVVTDVRMPPDHSDDGLRAAIEIRRQRPQTGVLVLSHYVAERSAFDLVGASADGVGYLLKDRVRDLDDFIDAVRRVAQGGSALDPEVITRLLGRHREDPLSALSQREREVLALIAEGRSNYGIAERLVISEGAVEKNVHRILRKLDIPLDGGHRRVLAVLAFLRT